MIPNVSNSLKMGSYTFLLTGNVTPFSWISPAKINLAAIATGSPTVSDIAVYVSSVPKTTRDDVIFLNSLWNWNSNSWYMTNMSLSPGSNFHLGSSNCCNNLAGLAFSIP